MDDVWNDIQAERKELLGLLEGMDDAQLDAPTLCDEWRVRDVVGHLIGATEASIGGFLGGMVKNGFRINRFIAQEAIDIGSAPRDELLERFRTAIPSRKLPPGLKPPVELVDTLVHHQDIRRPQSLAREIPSDRLVRVAETMKGLSLGLGAKKRIRGVALKATDADWSHGDGPSVEGPLEALVMMMAGRPSAADDLAGEGAAIVAQRF